MLIVMVCAIPFFPPTNVVTGCQLTVNIPSRSSTT